MIMKLRVPKRFATAVTRIKNAIGEEKAAEVVARSPSLIRKWADPDHPSRPNLPQALALDVAYVEGGHGDPPILALYQQRLARAVVTEMEKPPIDVVLAALSVQAAVGDISQNIVAKRAGDSAGSAFSPNEKNQILCLLERLQQQVAQIEDALDDGSPLIN